MTAMTRRAAREVTVVIVLAAAVSPSRRPTRYHPGTMARRNRRSSISSPALPPTNVTPTKDDGGNDLRTG
jgi:hypothetical protein